MEPPVKAYLRSNLILFLHISYYFVHSFHLLKQV